MVTARSSKTPPELLYVLRGLGDPKARHPAITRLNHRLNHRRSLSRYSGAKLEQPW